MEESTIFN